VFSTLFPCETRVFSISIPGIRTRSSSVLDSTTDRREARVFPVSLPAYGARVFSAPLRIRKARAFPAFPYELECSRLSFRKTRRLGRSRSHTIRTRQLGGSRLLH